MVRTYTFNPSTQSSLSTSLPALPAVSVFANSASTHRRAGAVPVPPPAAHQSQFGHHLPPPDPPSHYGGISSNASSAGVREEYAFSTAATNSADHHKMVVEEEPITFIGIRSVLINGQRFFQPISAPSSSASVPVAPFLAFTAANNGQSHHKNLVLPNVLPAAEDNPPWIRANPQPKNGLRGSQAWQETFEASKKANFGASFGSELGDGWMQTNKVAAQEKHRDELMAQIEEKRQRRMRERQCEWEMEEKERIKDELYQQRMRIELEEEKRKARERALLSELKMAKLAAVQRASEESLRAAKNRENQNGKARGQKAHPNLFDDSNGMAPPRHQQQQRRGEGTTEQREEETEEQLEWWERKDRRRKMEEANRNGAKSPAIPTLAAAGSRGLRRTASGDSRRSGGGESDRGKWHTQRATNGR